MGEDRRSVVLLTGASGYIGGRLLKALERPSGVGRLHPRGLSMDGRGGLGGLGVVDSLARTQILPMEFLPVDSCADQ